MSGKGQKKISRAICLLMVFLTALQLAGCAGAEENQEETDAPVKQEVPWKGENFGEVMELTEGDPVYLVEYQEGIENLPDLSGKITILSVQSILAVIRTRYTF